MDFTVNKFPAIKKPPKQKIYEEENFRFVEMLFTVCFNVCVSLSFRVQHLYFVHNSPFEGFAICASPHKNYFLITLTTNSIQHIVHQMHGVHQVPYNAIFRENENSEKRRKTSHKKKGE